MEQAAPVQAHQSQGRAVTGAGTEHSDGQSLSTFPVLLSTRGSYVLTLQMWEPCFSLPHILECSMDIRI